jgi:hypothetical protein
MLGARPVLAIQPLLAQIAEFISAVIGAGAAGSRAAVFAFTGLTFAGVTVVWLGIDLSCRGSLSAAAAGA